MVFEGYARFYDLYYARKDYAAEADFVLGLASRFGDRPPSRLLDMGCGTGRHLAEFLRRGLECDGFDLSPAMLANARERLAGTDTDLREGNLVDFRNGKEYDLAVSMFAVMGYLARNEDLIAGFRTAGAHLRPGGLLVFDAWFGPAVLSERPTERRHEYRDGDDTVVRKVTPRLDPVRQTVTASYEVTVLRDGRAASEVREDHVMRFLFVQETALALSAAGLVLLHACPFLDPDGELSTETWNVAFVARRPG